jgi:cbb3-type cytochrome c oxidase subunit II
MKARFAALRMTVPALVAGTMSILVAAVLAVVFLPAWEDPRPPSDAWRARTAPEDEGRRLYIANGCLYCHSQFVRPQDRDYGQDRVAQGGDYAGDLPPLLGSERQGPDLSQEGGLRHRDWHAAHFANPRFVRPDSLMPPFAHLGPEGIERLEAYLQSLGGRDADARMARQRFWHTAAKAAHDAGPAANMTWLHDNVPKVWRDMPSPYPATPAALERGEWVFQRFCIGCHGPVGDGLGPAAASMDVKPFNFTYLKKWPGPVGGMIHYQVMNGITGTAMMPFQGELESEKIWDVGHYVRVYFAGGDPREPGGRAIPASYEPLAPEENLDVPTSPTPTAPGPVDAPAGGKVPE